MDFFRDIGLRKSIAFTRRRHGSPETKQRCIMLAHWWTLVTTPVIVSVITLTCKT